MLAVLYFLASVPLIYALVPKGFNNRGLPPQPLAPAVSASDERLHRAFRTAYTNEEHPSLDTVYLFDQYIDHNDLTLGTFKQRFWVSWEYYEPGACGKEWSAILV